MREWLSRVVDWCRRGSLERELNEELQFHRRQLEREAREDGASPDVARQQAAMRLGRASRITEETRERWSIPSLENLQKDVRYAWRSLRRAPAFTAAAVLTLSLGIGANAAMFDVIDRLMFRPLAGLRDPETVHRVYLQVVERNGVTQDSWLPYARYIDLQTWTTSFAQSAAFSERTMMVGTGEAARERRVAAVASSYFDLFDAPAAAGRYFSAQEDVAPIGNPVAVISYAFWHSEYGGRSAIGEPLAVGALNATIIGVAHPDHAGVTDALPAAVFLPITALGPAIGGAQGTRFSSGYGFLWGHMLVRRKPGVSIETASADATQAFVRSWEAHRAAEPKMDLQPAGAAQPRAIISSVRPGAGPAPSLEVRTAMWVSGVAAIVLLIACANVTNLVLGRAIARQRETAVRVALGAGRARLVTQDLSESLLLALMSAAGAVLVAKWSVGAIFGILMPAAADIRPLDARTLTAIAAAALGAGLVLGLVPAYLVPRGSLPESLKVDPRAGLTTRSTLRATLVAAQAALSVVLLIGAVLFVRSLKHVRAEPLGFDSDRVLLVNTVMRGVALDPPARVALRRRLLDAAASLPSVEAASWRMSTPLGGTATLRFFVPGVASVGRLGQFTAQEATADYFKVMGTRILRGRGFTGADVAGAPPVVVVSASMASVLWKDADPLGQCLHFNRETAPCTSVVGVAEDIAQNSITAPERYHYYLPLDQTMPGGGTGMVLRLRGGSASEADAIRRALLPVMPPGAYITTQPMSDLVSREYRSWRLGATMFVALGWLALAVASVGWFGLIRYNVAQRTHEIGVRAALGAGSRQILWLVIAPNLRLALLGIATGCAIALSGSSRIQPLLFRQSATDPSAYATVAILIAVVTLAACAMPALRAAKAPPVRALRAE